MEYVDKEVLVLVPSCRVCGPEPERGKAASIAVDTGQLVEASLREEVSSGQQLAGVVGRRQLGLVAVPHIEQGV